MAPCCEEEAGVWEGPWVGRLVPPRWEDRKEPEWLRGYHMGPVTRLVTAGRQPLTTHQSGQLPSWAAQLMRLTCAGGITALKMPRGVWGVLGSPCGDWGVNQREVTTKVEKKKNQE